MSMKKVTQWSSQVEQLASIASSYPQEAYSAFTHGFISKWTYHLWTFPNNADILQPLENAIRQHLIPAVTGKASISDLERKLFSLPVHLGGLNIPNPVTKSGQEYLASLKITALLVDCVCQQQWQLDYRTVSDQIAFKSQVQKEKRESQSAEAEQLYSQLPPTLRKSP